MTLKETLQTKYSQIIQEAGAKHAAADAARIKQIISLCNELLTPAGGSANDTQESARITEAIKECDSCLAWLKEQAATKTEDGVDYPKSAYAYTPSDTPSEWKLRLWEDPTKKVTKTQLGRAAAAFSPGGFRGNKVEIPEADMAGAKQKVRSSYKTLGVSDDDIPKWVKESESRQILSDFTPLTESSFKSGKGVITIIKPGFNAGKGRYYPPETLARDKDIFRGAKMFADHPTEADDRARPERSIRDWVGSLVGEVFVGAGGALQSAFNVVEPWFESKLNTLRDKDMMKEIGTSINAIGSASDATIEGTKTKLIERLIRARSVDFVTEPGAGGGIAVYESADPTVDIDLIDAAQIRERRPDIVRLIESEVEAKNKQEAKKLMESEAEVKSLKESNETLTKEVTELKAKITEADKAKAKAEAQALIKEAIAKTTLPDAAKERLTEQFKEAVSVEGVDVAIKAETDYIAKITESGKVRGLGAKPQILNEAEAKKANDALVESFKGMGMTAEQAEIAARGR